MSNYSNSEYSEEGANTSWQKALNLVPKGSKVLDVGCSSGNFGKVLIEKKNCTVDGLELDAADAKLASKWLRNVYNLNIETDDLGELKDKYDIIYFGDVIEHLYYPSSTLKRVQKLLKPGGSILFSIPNMAHATIRLLLLTGDFEYTETGLLDKTHLHFYNLKEVERVFNEADMEISKLDYVEKDYPDQLIKDYLSKLGLSVNQNSSFLSNMRKVDAAAFQFIGLAKPASKKIPKKKLKQFGPVDMFESYHTNIVNDLQRQVNELSADAEKWRQLRRNPIKAVSRKIARRLGKR
jgi:2-polyprenyl-3-methyl-5-hydroxy-6-metoxy-1,4-benzoquinol methylase